MRSAATVAGGRYIPRFHKNVNARDAFSHSVECDNIFIIVTNEPGGVAHVGCRCWCHNTQDLYVEPDGLEYDVTPPPEYANSADIYAASLLKWEHPVNTPYPIGKERPDSNVEGNGKAAPLQDNEHISISQESAVVDNHYSFTSDSLSCLETSVEKQFPNRSPHEVATGKCDTCGDKLAVCECVE